MPQTYRDPAANMIPWADGTFTYRVNAYAPAWAWTAIEVNAKTAEEAETLALAKLETGDYPDWSYDHDEEEISEIARNMPPVWMREHAQRAYAPE